MYDVIIIGSGPAGLTAAIYTTRANLKTLIIAGSKWGGQLQLTTLVENYPGFPEGIQGPDLMSLMRKQAERFGAEIIDKDFISGDFNPQAGGPFEVSTSEKTYEGKSIIIATGADTKWLGIKGEMEKIGRGVSSCAPCDAPFFRNKKVIVVGGGDSAMEEALVLTNFAQEVTIVHRRDAFRASQIMQDRMLKNRKVKILFNTEVTEILGEGKVVGVRIKSKIKDQNSKIPACTCPRQTALRRSRCGLVRQEPMAGRQIKIQNQEREVSVEEIGGKRIATSDGRITWEMPTDGVFVAIGHIPNSKVFAAAPATPSQASGLRGGRGVEMDQEGYIKVFEHTKTNIEGVFVAGDVHDKHYQQAVTAAGFGCMAALEAEKWLRNQD